LELDAMDDGIHEVETVVTKPGRRFDWFFVVLVVGFLGFYLYMGRTAPTPEVFATSTSLTEAMTQSEVEGKVVVAVATADWCGSCQSFKRGALSDEKVTAWLDANAIPVYINVDDDPEAANVLGVSGIPATFVIVDGEVKEHLTGAYKADDLLEVLEQY
jgi:thioredoxin